MTLTRSWLALIALAVATTVVAAVAPGPLRLAAAAVMLALSWAKAGLILGRFLDLSSRPGWLAGLRLATGLFLVVAFGLYAAA